MISDWLDEIWAFILYWGFGWGILLIGILAIVWIIVKGFKSSRYRGNTEKGFIIFGLIVVVVLTIILFKSITNYAIDVDPNRMTEEEKSLQKQLEEVVE